MDIKLIGNKSSPFVRKVEIVLQELDLKYSFQQDSPWEPDSLVATLNPIGKIPIIIINKDITLFDSSVITDFLIKMIPNSALLDNSEAIDDKLLITVINGILDTSILYSWELKRPKDKIDSNVLDKYKLRIESCLRYINEFYRVEKKQFSLSDILMVCAIDYLLLRQFFPVKKEDYHHLSDRYKELYMRKSIVTTSPLPVPNSYEGGWRNV